MERHTNKLLYAYGAPYTEAYRISSNRMRALYLFQCFDIACIIQGRFVFEGALYFLPMKSYPLISYEISNRKQGQSRKIIQLHCRLRSS